MARKDPLDKLALRHDVAVRSFLDAAEELEAVADDLYGIAADADAAAQAAALRAGSARTQALAASNRAERIRGLLG